MGLIVVDASVLVELLVADDGPRRKAASGRLASGAALYAPSHMDLEVMSALRGIAHKNAAVAADGPALIARLLQLPIRREALAGSVAERMWQLRSNMTVYDAGYVALAEHLHASILTCDAKFTRTPGIGCAIELIA